MDFTQKGNFQPFEVILHVRIVRQSVFGEGMQYHVKGGYAYLSMVVSIVQLRLWDRFFKSMRSTGQVGQRVRSAGGAQEWLMSSLRPCGRACEGLS